MIVLIVENSSASFRGELTRWLLQIKTGVFVGNISARVREKLWERILNQKKKQSASMIFSSNSDQGFSVLNCGNTKFDIVDYDGFILTKINKSK